MVSRGINVHVLSNIKAVSTITIILLMIISAIAGGLISYMFTIALYIEIPKRTTLTITDVHFDKGNASSFDISVLNPSYSPENATITRIGLSLKGEPQIYDVIQTEPPIENGIVIPKGTSLNITCSKVRRDDVNVTWGSLAGEFANKTIIVHVFSPDSPAANLETTLPYVKLHIAETVFDAKVSFKKFSITLINDVNSEINLTLNGMVVAGVENMEISPEPPCTIAKEPVHFAFNGSWHGLNKTTITIYTEEGYTFSEEIELPEAHALIPSVTFNEDYTDYFNVTVANLPESDNYVNVTRITCTLENGTIITRDYDPSIGIMPNSTHTFPFNEPWREYRGKRVDVKAYLLQEFETESYNVTSPPAIIVKVSNEKEVFDLKDKDHLNITLLNHPSSLQPINITEIVVKENGNV